MRILRYAAGLVVGALIGGAIGYAGQCAGGG